LNQFWSKTPVMSIKLDLIPHAWDGHNSFVRTPNRGLFLPLDAQWLVRRLVKRIYENRTSIHILLLNYLPTSLKKSLLGPVPDVANDRSYFTSWESDCASNVSQVARKQRVDLHRIIRSEKSSSFESILSQNSCDGYQVRFDPPCMRWS
jgi:hypothetical protein